MDIICCANHCQDKLSFLSRVINSFSLQPCNKYQSSARRYPNRATLQGFGGCGQSAVIRRAPAPLVNLKKTEFIASTPPAIAPMDTVLNAADSALRTLFAKPHACRTCPTVAEQGTTLSAADKALAGALMRVNQWVRFVRRRCMPRRPSVPAIRYCGSSFWQPARKKATTLPGRVSGWTSWVPGPCCY